MALLTYPPLHLTLLHSTPLPSSTKHCPLRSHASSISLASSSPLQCNRIFSLSVSSAQAEVIQSTTSEGESEGKTRLIAQNVPWTSTLDEVRVLFERYGSVTDVELSMHNKGRNRGLAFVTMGTEDEALNALNNLNSIEFEGRVIKVEFARSGKKKASPPPPKTVTKGNTLFVGNLTWGVNATELREFFEAVNEQLVSVQVIYHSQPRKPAGYGFISFNSKEAAEAAITAFNRKELKGRNIRLALSNSQTPQSELVPD